MFSPSGSFDANYRSVQEFRYFLKTHRRARWAIIGFAGLIVAFVAVMGLLYH